MSEQILDIGDVVQIAEYVNDREGIVVGIDGEDVTVCWQETATKPWYAQVNWSIPRLKRVGGPLQLGDCVRVTGACEQGSTTDVDELEGDRGIIVDDYDTVDGPDFRVFVQGMDSSYECRAGQLVRITRAEALA